VNFFLILYVRLRANQVVEYAADSVTLIGGSEAAEDIVRDSMIEGTLPPGTSPNTEACCLLTFS
jgi:hypothetical protein